MMFKLYCKYRINNGNGKINKKKRRRLEDYSKGELTVKRDYKVERLNETAKEFETYVINQERNLIIYTFFTTESGALRMSPPDLNLKIYREINRLESQFERAINGMKKLNNLLPEKDRIDLKQYHDKKEEMGDILQKRIRAYVSVECRKVRSGDDEKGLMRRMGIKEEDSEWCPPIVETPWVESGDI